MVDSLAGRRGREQGACVGLGWLDVGSGWYTTSLAVSHSCRLSLLSFVAVGYVMACRSTSVWDDAEILSAVHRFS